MEMYGVRNVFDEADRGSDKNSVLSSGEDRLFFIYGDITSKNCASIAYDITQINIEDDRKDKKEKNYTREPIRIFINSYGGSVYAMWMLIDAVDVSKTPVYTYCNGYCMSAAFQIFLSGHKRFVSRHATLMYHQIYCWRSGKYQDMVDDREHMDHLNKQIEDYVIERTKLSSEDLIQIREKKKDTYYTADDAINLGIADEVMKVSTKRKGKDEEKL